MFENQWLEIGKGDTHLLSSCVIAEISSPSSKIA